jgi:hypothetical protein
MPAQANGLGANTASQLVPAVSFSIALALKEYRV